MKISIFGMGYVGVATGACLAASGHEVVGVDVSAEKVDAINCGVSPVVEDGLNEILADAVAEGTLRATTDAPQAVHDSDISMVAVGTPSAPNGSLSVEFVERVSREIGGAVRGKNGPHTVIYRSTVLPGTTEGLLIPALGESSGRGPGDGLEVFFNPEFMREGSSVADFHAPPMTVIGGAEGADLSPVEALYRGVKAPFIPTSYRVAEAVKYMSNAFHAVKITFANEMGTLLGEMGIDARAAAELFCRDTKLNISPSYLRPGYAFGGSCLPKDLRAILDLAKRRDVAIPMLEAVLPSNRAHIERAYGMIAAHGRRRVALFGLSFKPGTDDLRESPLVALAELLIGKGFELDIFDRHVQTARLTGANRSFIEREIPHLDRLIETDATALLDRAETIVVGHAEAPEIDAIAALPPGRPVIDLQGVAGIQAAHDGHYQGICW